MPNFTITTLPHTTAFERIDVDVDEDTPVIEVHVDGEPILSIDLRTVTAHPDHGDDQQYLVILTCDEGSTDWNAISEVEL